MKTQINRQNQRLYFEHFSKEYRAAKIDLKKLIVKFHADYKNDPYVILYEQRLSEKLKENPPLKK
ncbi:MAG: hypothetical protein HWD61_01305 [Parachlamydiaceae bacterium]|nr:MAG: hypothetical protein HWD61_01305 [Parachlamydiaceae bacterium]